jgi:hypothetical protein
LIAALVFEPWSDTGSLYYLMQFLTKFDIEKYKYQPVELPTGSIVIRW